MGIPFGTPGCGWEGVSYRQPQRGGLQPWPPCSAAVDIFVAVPCLDLVGRFGSQPCEHTKSTFSPNSCLLRVFGQG